MSGWLMDPAEDGQLFRYTAQPRMASHEHQVLEFNLVARGSLRYLVRNQRFDLRRHHLIWVPPGSNHVLLDPSPDCLAWVVHVRPEVLRRHVGPTSLLDQRLFENRPAWLPARPLAARDGRRLGDLLETLFTRAPGNGCLSRPGEGQLAAHNAGLVFALLEAWAAFQAAASDLAPECLSPAVELAAHYLSRPDAETDGDLAALVGMPAKRLNRIFRHEMGTDITTYRNRCRLARFFDRYVPDGGLTMLQCALDAGFGSYAQFHRVFVHITGVTPRRHAADANSTPGAMRRRTPSRRDAGLRPTGAQPMPTDALPDPVTTWSATNVPTAHGEPAFFRKPATPLTPAFTLLPFGAVRPAGWIKEQMDLQIRSGFTSFLDQLSPVIMQDDIWGKQRRSTRRPDEINIPGFNPADQNLRWWNGESQGNWFDGFIRTALLTGDAHALARTRILVDRLIASQDEDGYFGVYDPTLRLRIADGNGELWTQAVALRALLGFYEYSGEVPVLAMVERAVGVTMGTYREGGIDPFAAKNNGGISHGLMFADITEMLHRLTGKEVYRDYTVWLYRSFCRADPEDNDVHYQLLSDPTRDFVGHSAHTFEHLRVLLYAWYFTGHRELQRAAERFETKMAKVLLPSGVPFGFENLWGMHAHPDRTGAEYCNMVEYALSMSRAQQLTGRADCGDRVEAAFFNGMQGARLPDERGCTYDKTDNCYELTMHNPGYDPVRGHGYHERDSRYKYSPTQEDAAVCCVPNAVRAYPHFVANMWMRASDGLVATLYGPCRVETTWDGVPLVIEVCTDYPFADDVAITVTPQHPLAFTLRLRRPGWATTMDIKVQDGETKEDDGFIHITRTWNAGDRVDIHFAAEVMARSANDGSLFFHRGPLVYALPIPAQQEVIRSYPVPGFHDYQHTPVDEAFRRISLAGGDASRFRLIRQPGIVQTPWATPPLSLVGPMLLDGVETEIRLVPMGATILRRVTFT